MSSTEAHVFDGDGTIPNSRLPLLVHRAALAADAAAIEQAFAAHGWPPAWRNGVYPWHHFHPHTHEALGVASGRGRVQFGGPGGVVVDLAAGDVVVVPAGVGHCGLEASADMVIVGAYPAGGGERDASRGDPARCEEMTAAVRAVGVPPEDPALGPTGGVARLWR